MNNIIIYIFPLLLVIYLLIIDKLLTQKKILMYTESRAEYYFYKSKESILKLQKDERDAFPNKHPLMILGTSHLGELSMSVFSEVRPDILPYNYSAPYPSYSYYHYILHKAILLNLIPKYIILELNPVSLEDKSNEYPLKYSYDWNYIFSQNSFSLEENDLFLRANIFNTQIFPFRITEIIKKLKHPDNVNLFLFLKEEISKGNFLNRGGIPNHFLGKVPERELIDESEKYYKNSIENIQFSKTQIDSLQKIFDICRINNIIILTVETPVHPHLASKIQNSQIGLKWKNFIVGLQKKNYFRHLQLQDFIKEFPCMDFLDSHHLSGGCFEAPTRIILRSLP